jgi:hypothetical protein
MPTRTTRGSITWVGEQSTSASAHCRLTVGITRFELRPPPLDLERSADFAEDATRPSRSRACSGAPVAVCCRRALRLGADGQRRRGLRDRCRADVAGLNCVAVEPAPRGWLSAPNCRNNPILSDSHGKAPIDLAQPPPTFYSGNPTFTKLRIGSRNAATPRAKPLGSIITSVADPTPAKRRRDGFRFRKPVTPPHGPTRDGANPPFPRAPRSRSPSSPRSRARGRRRRH